ncbi:MAG: protease pro-enzyme activation domain-containing protein [Thermaerobacter sp.]|nr:protease pro-enzyme activation domain-containing protein [Thermaerobacter sp.]
MMKKLIGLALAATVPGLGLVSATVSATTPQAVLLPAMDPVLPQSVLAGSQRLSTLSPSSPFSFGVVLPSRDPQGLAQFAKTASQPGTPGYRQFLTPSQVAARFGPASAVVSQIQAGLAANGLTAHLGGQILQVHGTVGQVDQMFQTQLARYQKGSTQFVAPDSALVLPNWIRGAAGLTGFVTSTPQTGFQKAKMLKAVYAPKAAMGSTPVGASNSASSGNFTVNVQMLSGAAHYPGMAVRYLVTATLNGQPDTNFLFVNRLQGPILGPLPLVMWYSNPPGGQMVVDFSLAQQQTVSAALTVRDTAGNQVTVQLPAAEFRGPAAATTNAAPLFGIYGITGNILAPWNPATNSVNTVFHANQLVSQVTAVEGGNVRPAIGVYTAGNVFAPSENDVGLFAQQFGLMPPNISTAYVGPNVYTSNLGGIEGELSLDLQMMETSAPGANIAIYAAGSLRSALNQVNLQDRVSVFSISYGGGELAEQAYAPGAQASWDLLAQIANAEGITISVSAGDSGAYSGAQFGMMQPQPSYPANSPYVSAVGGTEDAVTPGAQVTQAAMWGGNIGRELSNPTLLSFLSLQNMIASGGVSTLEPAPYYQTHLNPTLPGRMTPDFSLPASVVTPGYYAFFGGWPNLSGGTSAGAPLFAGWVADMAFLRGRLGNVNPLLYEISQWPAPLLPDGPIMTPVSYGNNGVYNITTRDNAVTGLGQLNMGALWAVLSRFYFGFGGGAG